MTTGRWLARWDPNDDGFWQSAGRRIARRNLSFSILAEFLGFSVWQLWSVVVIGLPKAGFHLSVSELFWLVSVPGLVGATLRFPYGFAVPLMGGRNWTVVSASLLLIPTILLGVLVQNPDTPYWLLLLAAGTAGFGGGNFASSMANISYFYPDRQKGAALGINAAGGNIGVAMVQLVVPAVIGLGILGLGARTLGRGAHLSLEWAGFMWVPLIVIAMICAHRFMDNLHVARATLREQLVIVRRRNTWVMSWLYIGTFGSFIGYSAALPLLIKTQFTGVNPLEFAFLGPLVGSVARPLGGWLSDRIGGTVVTFGNFIVMGLAALGVIFTLNIRTEPGAFPLFLGLFMILFVTSGVGNGSTFRMIPAIFRADRLRAAGGSSPAALERAGIEGRREAAGVLGFSSAIAAYGSFAIPQLFSFSISQTGAAIAALIGFICYYATCVGVTWWFYLRREARVSAALPALAGRRAV